MDKFEDLKLRMNKFEIWLKKFSKQNSRKKV
jgi:hypothetical protein